MDKLKMEQETISNEDESPAKINSSADELPVKEELQKNTDANVADISQQGSKLHALLTTTENIKEEIDDTSDQSIQQIDSSGNSELEDTINTNNVSLAIKEENTYQKNKRNNILSILTSQGLEDEESENPYQTENQEDDGWLTVGFIKGNSATISQAYDYKGDLSNLSLENLPNLEDFPAIALEPGCAYMFRIAAINSVGVGEWSDVSAFKTCLPGFPGAPSQIKISKMVDGAHLSWEPPSNNPDDIEEYSVYLAVKGKEKQDASTQLAFIRVYCGTESNCLVSTNVLVSAHLDKTTKPAVVFRIAAKNEKGYGPATQVRWLQDNATQKNGNKRSQNNSGFFSKKNKC